MLAEYSHLYISNVDSLQLPDQFLRHMLLLPC